MVCSLNESSYNWSAGDSAHFQKMYTILFAVGFCVLVLLVWACCICPYTYQMSKKTLRLDLTDNKGTVEGMRHTLTHTIQGGKVQVVVGHKKMVNGDATSDTSSNDSCEDGQDVSRNVEVVSFENTNNNQSFAIEIV